MAWFFADDPESEAWLEAAADDQPDMALRALVPAADALEALRGQVLNLTPAELIDAVVTTAVVIGRIERWGDHATRLDDLEALRGFAATSASECAASGAAATLQGPLLRSAERVSGKSVSVRVDHGARRLTQT